MLGCAPTLEEQVAGTWAVDADAWLADPSLRALPAEVRRSLDPIARSMVAEARFTFDATGETRGERFTLRAGESVTVRASFTGATPTVRIQR